MLRFAFIHVTQSNANPACFVNRIFTKIAALQFYGTHGKSIHAFGFVAKKKRKKRRNKTSYTSKEDYAIFVARIVSSRKTKRSCVLERQSSRIVLPIAFNLQRTSRGVEATRRKAPLKCRRGYRENPFPKGPKRLFQIDRDTCRL